MEEKKYKRVPFTIEIAKRIQSGEIEGRIKSIDGLEIKTIIRINGAKTYNNEQLSLVEYVNGKKDFTFFEGLFIELPEEAPIDNDGNHGFCRFIPNPNHREGVMGDYSLAPLNENESINILKSSVSTKYEFKPFDKVLVKYDKEGAKWFPTILSQVINGLYVNVADKVFKECIPYEGNEHLVGTTNKPE